MRTVRWAAVVAVVCLVVAVAAVAYAAGKAKVVPAQEVVRAKRFEVVDGKRKVRVRIDAMGDNATIALLDRKGRLQALLQSSDGGASSLNLWSTRGKDGIAMFFVLDTSPMVAVGDLNAQAVTVSATALSASSKEQNTAIGSGGLSMFGPGGRVSANVEKQGASLTLSDVEGMVRTALGRVPLVTTRTGATGNTAVSSLVLFDKEGKVLWQAP